jgi:hypothetical protein
MSRPTVCMRGGACLPRITCHLMPWSLLWIVMPCMSLFSASLEPWLPTLFAFLVPFSFRLLPMFCNPPQPTMPAPTPLCTSISAFLVFYILYMLCTLTFARPPNLFMTLCIPLDAPQSTIHSALLLQQLQQLRPNES